ncbi:MAG: CoB--CoM heterodisulfide reductase iron-sulfur subunit B family protein [Proteobacteria bacterium]|nr:CoB--CoM heterodisulfide reductase iron-sulfur subunit B family protein [Pseudomonadota bacterium]
MNQIQYAYFPGCSQTGTAVEYDMSVRATAKALDVELIEIPDWTCCGSSPAQSADKTLMAALTARNLRLVEEMGRAGVVTPCPSCLKALKVAGEYMEHDHGRGLVGKLLDRMPAGAVPSASILQVFVEDVGLEEIAKRVVRPLKGLVAAPYYGCVLTRPKRLMGFDDEEDPQSMDKLLRALGAQVPDFPFKVECCGASYGVPRREIVVRQSGRILDMARRVGANAIVTACPLCHQNLDLRQGQAARSLDTRFDLPILYVTQVLGLALGLEYHALGLDKHAVNVRTLVDAVFEAPRPVNEEADRCE